MAVTITYNGVNPFGTFPPTISEEVIRQDINGYISSIDRFTLSGVIKRSSCSSNFSTYEASKEVLKSQFFRQFKPFEIQENGTQVFYHPAAKVTITFPSGNYSSFYRYEIVVDCVRGYNNQDILDPVNEWQSQEDENGMVTLTHTVAARGVGDNALEKAKRFVLEASDSQVENLILHSSSSQDLQIAQDVVAGVYPQTTEATSYISALLASSPYITVSELQKKIIHAFYYKIKTAGCLPGLLRLIIPIWGIDTSGLLDLANPGSSVQTVGSVFFSGNVVSANGGGGIIDFLLYPLNDGLTPNNVHLGALITGTPVTLTNNFDIGSRVAGSDKELNLGVNYNGTTYAAAGETPGLANYIQSSTVGNGLYSFNCTASGQVLTLNTGGGPQTIGSRSTNIGSFSNFSIFGLSSYSSDGFLSGSSYRTYQSFFIAKDWSQDQANLFSTELYNLVQDLQRASAQNRFYSKLSNKTFLDRFSGQVRNTETWIYDPRSTSLPGVLTYQTSVGESNGETTVEISGEIQVTRVGASSNEISSAKTYFNSIDFQAIAQQEYQNSGGSLTLSNLVSFSVNENPDLGTVNFSMSWNSLSQGSPYIVDKSTVMISKSGESNCFQYSGKVTSDAKCSTSRASLIKTFFDNVDWNAKVLQKWAKYGTGQTLTANAKSKSITINNSTGDITFSITYCADPELECGAIEAFKYSMEWTPSITKYAADPVLNGTGQYIVQNLGFKNRQLFSINGTAKRIKCYSKDAAKGEIRARVNLIMVKYFPSFDRILISNQISEDKNGDFFSFSFSWSGKAN